MCASPFLGAIIANRYILKQYIATGSYVARTPKRRRSNTHSLETQVQDVLESSGSRHGQARLFGNTQGCTRSSGFREGASGWCEW